MYYARSDTHYLLYIYDKVRNDLVSASKAPDAEVNHIEQVLQQSRELSLSRHEHPGYDEITGQGSRGWYGYVFKHSHLAFNSEQFSVFKALWSWRDTTARKEDESPHFVLSTTNITEIARINPPDAKALHSLLPLAASLARPRFSEIWDQIKEAKAQGGPSLLHFFTEMAPDTLRRNGLPIAARETTKLLDLEDGEVTVTRLTKSQLFGDMPISTRWEESKRKPDEQDDRIPFPWQRFVEQNADEGDLQYDQAPTQDATPEGQPVEVEATAGGAEPEEDVDQEFTLKRGQKRKSSAVEADEVESSADDSEADSDEEMEDANGLITVVDEPQKKSRKGRKRDRRAQNQIAKQEQLRRQEEKQARKALKREKKQKEKQEKEKKYDAVPFDYSKAASVLHAAREPNGGEAQGKKKVFDPYSKTGDDGLKGARKAPPVRGERSATFKK